MSNLNSGRDASNSPAVDKAKGHAKEIIGTVKSKVGSLTGDRDLQAEGYAQNAEGKGDRLKGEIKEKIDDVKNVVKAGVDAVKEKFSDARNNK